MLKIVLPIVVVAFFYLSLSQRVQEKQRSIKRGRELPVEPQESAFSQAVVELLATAGGVYLALFLVKNFLQITVPEHVVILGIQLEPMAALSLLIAILQPYFAHISRSSW